MVIISMVQRSQMSRIGGLLILLLIAMPFSSAQTLTWLGTF